jgi:hypothetical protein
MARGQGQFRGTEEECLETVPAPWPFTHGAQTHGAGGCIRMSPSGLFFELLAQQSQFASPGGTGFGIAQAQVRERVEHDVRHDEAGI